MARIVALAMLVTGFWLLSAYGPSRPDAQPADAPAAQFSAGRADAVLARVLEPQQPHPVGSPQGQMVRARILKELAALGVAARTESGMSCYVPPHGSFLPCGSVTNIVAEVSPGKGKAVLLMAHADSVAAGPGEADDGSGVAILLEAIRALKARGASGAINPVTALFTDGEEADLLGAAFHIQQSENRDRVGVVINAEARGNKGPSYLFQTSPGNGKLIDLYARSARHYATSSLYDEIYKRLPNDTDFTPLNTAGVPGYNFAFIGGGAQYHTPLDRRENLDPRSLQQQGDAVLGLADTLRRTDLGALKGPDAIYLDVLGHWLPRLPVSWALPLSIAAFLLIALAGILTPHDRHSGRRLLVAAVAPLLMLAASVGLGFALHGLAAWFSGHDDPSFAYPVWLRLSLGFGAFAVALVAARGAGAIFCWLWFAGLAIVCSFWAPGLVPFFLYPAVVAAPLLLLTVRAGRSIALFVSALAALTIWIGFNQGSEAIMGLRLHPLFMVSAAFGLLSLLPLLKGARGWKPAFVLSLLLAVALAAVAGLKPAYSASAPLRLNLAYFEQEGRAWWLADPVEALPESLRQVAHFSTQPQRLMMPVYVAAAGKAQFPAPSVQVHRQGDVVTLDLGAPGDGWDLLVPREAGLTAISLDGLRVPAAGRRHIFCATPDCGSAHLVLNLASSRAVTMTLFAEHQGLPPQGATLLRARPDWAVPSQVGDRRMRVVKVTIPAR